MSLVHFKPGEQVGGIRIMYRMPAEPGKETGYLVACLKCGRESVLKYSSVLRRVRQEVEGCRACNRHERHSSPRKEQIKPAEGIMLGRGNWWPKLSGWSARG